MRCRWLCLSQLRYDSGMTGISKNPQFSALFDWFSRPEIDEILIDGGRNLWLLRGHRRERLPSPFVDLSDLRQRVLDLARASGVRLDPVIGAAGGSLDNGAFRWHCILPPMAPDGPLLSVRRHRFDRLSLADFDVPTSLLADIKTALLDGSHMIFAGPTGSGKSSFMAALLRLLPIEERIFIIESVPELSSTSLGAVRLTPRAANREEIGGFSLDRLLAETLRMLPDRIVIGEVRGQEAPVLLDAMRSGHRGLMTTMHASSADEVIARIGSRLPLGEQGWEQTLSLPVAVILTKRGDPPGIQAMEWIHGA